MSQRTVYDSGPLTGRGASKHVKALAAALRKQYPARGFTVHVVAGEVTIPHQRPKATYRLVVERKPG